jgi:hypothetical protein
MSDTGNYQNLLLQNNAIGISTLADGVTLNLGDLATDNGGSSLTVDEWNHIAWTRNGNSQLVYLNGVLDISASSAYSASQWNMFRWNTGGTDSGGDWRIAHLKMWDNLQLTVAEIQQEMRSARPQKTPVHCWYPFIRSNIQDLSGNGRDWTLVGTLNLEDGPPVGWGARPLILGVSGAVPRRWLLARP